MVGLRWPSWRDSRWVPQETLPLMKISPQCESSGFVWVEPTGTIHGVCESERETEMGKRVTSGLQGALL